MRIQIKKIRNHEIYLLIGEVPYITRIPNVLGIYDRHRNRFYAIGDRVELKTNRYHLPAKQRLFGTITRFIGNRGEYCVNVNVDATKSTIQISCGELVSLTNLEGKKLQNKIHETFHESLEILKWGYNRYKKDLGIRTFSNPRDGYMVRTLVYELKYIQAVRQIMDIPIDIASREIVNDALRDPYIHDHLLEI